MNAEMLTELLQLWLSLILLGTALPDHTIRIHLKFFEVEALPPVIEQIESYQEQSIGRGSGRSPLP
ncbi:MAG: hypothetical protein ACFBSC_17080 [Microcoleaceae cyanobacterium]